MVSEICEIETADAVHHIVPAYVFNEDHFTDAEFAGAELVTRGDFGWVTGRYCQFDDGTNTAFNRNGNMFAPTDYIHTASKTVVHTPLNMLHERKNTVGVFVGTSIIDPHHALADQLADAQKSLPFPYIDSVAAFWKYHFKQEWQRTKQAFDQGSAFLSMECVAETVTCMTPGCMCDGKTYKYAGLKSPTYCDALNRPRARKRLNYPHYVGGAMVVPPGIPAWARADITRVAASLEGEHAEEAEQIYEAIAANASHLEPREWEFLMAMVVAGLFSDEAERPKLEQTDFDRLFSVMITSEYDVEKRLQSAKDKANADAEAGQLVAAGLAVVAKTRPDGTPSNRALLMQRGNDASDPAANTWEFPGGGIEDGETPLDAARREWSEELGCEVPDGEIVGQWQSANGVYQAFVLLVESEADVNCNLDHDRRSVLNPDDPDGDEVEIAAWWDPATLPGMPALRRELEEQADWEQLAYRQRIMQEDSNYREAEEDTEECCGTCGYFDSITNACELVAGRIEPNGISDLYVPTPEAKRPTPIPSGVSYD